MEVLIGLIQLFCIDALVIAGLLILAIIMGIYRKASLAVLNRNFVAYFTNPTGYVFLCLFVLLASAAAFWPHEFFTNNLANLDQLNLYLPYLMVIYIPAITMSIWAEERRQGTDELLLTLPATDFDIVVGKYFAAAGIFTVSLLFSQVSNFLVLALLSTGDLDIGQFAVTYLGYWLIGLAMLSLGMVASFLTNNLTVGFVFGVLFNLPLVLLAWADVIVPVETLAQVVSRWSIASQFQDFGRGVITFSGLAYFAMTIVFGLYVAMVLIGRRHWLGGRDGESRIWHYLLRIVCFIVIILGLNLVLYRYNPLRADLTDAKLSSAFKDTRTLLTKLEPKNKIVINAFIGTPIPDRFIRTKFELLAMLREFEARSGGKIDVIVHDNLSTVGEEAKRAEELYGIRPRRIPINERGVTKQADVLLGVAITCGLEKVVIPFFDSGIPVEYELIRSITTVAGQVRKTIGVVNTDANMMGGFTMAGGMMPQNIPKQQIIDELEKQYQVEQIDPNAQIQVEIDDPENPGKKKRKYDMMLLVQPSSLTQPQLDNVITAIRQGQPTAIFEDPFPYFFQGVPATSQEKPPQGGMFGGAPPEPKGDISALWKILNLEVRKDRIVWQKYMPYLRLDLPVINDTWVFIRKEAPGAGDAAFYDGDAVSSNLEELLFLGPGYVRAVSASDYKITDLVETGTETGTIDFNDLRNASQMDEGLTQYQGDVKRQHYSIAARIRSNNLPKAATSKEESTDKKTSSTTMPTTGPTAMPSITPVKYMQDEDPPGPAKPPATPPAPTADKIDVIYVADIDCLSSQFLMIRAAGDEETVANFRFDNVPFVLNIVDSLAGDDRYLEIRKRKRRYGTLKVVDKEIETFRIAQQEELKKAEDDLKKKRDEAQAAADKSQKELEEKITEYQNKQAKGEEIDFRALRTLMQTLETQRKRDEQKRDQDVIQIAEERQKKINELRRKGELAIASIQNRYKLAALFFPPIPPLLIGIVVFAWRRLQEREGISKSRRR
jgi:ABC-2 type transport system permease protein